MNTKKYIKALSNNPGGFAENYNLGIVLHKNEDLVRSIKFFKRAIELNPKNETAYNDLGTVYNDLGKPKTALKYFKRSLSLNPQFADAVYNIGYTLVNSKGDNKLAKKYFEKAYALNPTHSKALSMYYQSIRGSANFALKEKLEKSLNELTIQELENDAEVGEYPFLNLTRKQDELQNLKVAQNWLARLNAPAFGGSSPHRSPAPDGAIGSKNIKNFKLKIGYLSDGLRDFPTGHNLANVIANHSKDVSIYVYTWGKPDNSIYENVVKERVDKYTDISNLSKSKAAKVLLSDDIDILVDLKGFTKDNKMGVLALKPAPIIINYLGYPGTTGSKFHDYIIADKIVIPEKSKKYFSEKVIYLDHCYRPADTLTPLVSSRTPIRDLYKKPIVFGSLNSIYKLDRETFKTWLDILNEVPSSELWMLAENKEAQKYLKKHKNIKFLEFTNKEEHLNRISEIDLCLDTTVVSGHTTTTDAGRVGVPTLCIQGRHFASRVSESVNHELKLEPLIAKDLKEYQKIAINFATNPKFRDKIRKSLILNRDSSVIFNSKQFANSLEKVYFALYKSHGR